MAQELELLAEWSDVLDLSDLSDLADLADQAAADLAVSDPTLSAQLTADADQLRAAIEDFTVQIEYVNDLERLLGGDDSPFSGVDGDVTFAPDVGRETSLLLDLGMVLELGGQGVTSQHISLDVTLAPALGELDTAHLFERGVTFGPAVGMETSLLLELGMVLDPGQEAARALDIPLDVTLTPDSEADFALGPPPPAPPVAIRELLDIETLIVKHLQADQTLITAGVKQIAGPESPKQPKWPMVRIHRIGGVAPVAFWLDGALIQVDIWGTTDTAKLRAMTSKVWVSLQKLVGVHLLGVVTGVQEIVGRGYLPDPQTSRPRYLMTIRVFAHANP